MIQKEFTQENVLLAPDNKPTVYKVLDKNEEIMYVGVANKDKFRMRLLGHLVVPYIPSDFFEFKQCKTMEQALQTAIEIKEKEDPEYNQFYEIDGRVIQNGQQRLLKTT